MLTQDNDMLSWILKTCEVHILTVNIINICTEKVVRVNAFLIFIFFPFLLLAAVDGSSNSTVIKGTLTERTGSTEEKTEEVEQMIMKITDKAAISLEDVTSTKEEALALEEEIKEALNSTQSK